MCTAIVAALSTGCGESGPHVVRVEGRVTYNGKPVGEGVVQFLPHSNSAQTPARPGAGHLQADGRYSMQSYGGREGVLPGEYQVAIAAFEYSKIKFPPEPNHKMEYTVPARYTQAATSDLKAIVPEDAKTPLRIDFDLTD